MAVVTPNGHALGWVKDLPDIRDFQFAERRPLLTAPPPSVDLRGPAMPPIVDQLSLGSCTGNAWASAYDYARAKQGLPFITPSRLFIYLEERRLEGTVASDAGAQIRDGIKVLANQGVCPESEWPYVISKFADRPPAQAYADALNNQVVQYMSVAQTAQGLMGALAQGFCVVYGFMVYNGFENAGANGMVPMPGRYERPLGGHANVIVGYDQNRQVWITRNSWGPTWGDKGYGSMPWAYLLNSSLASDFWAAEVVEGVTPPPNPYVVGPGIQRAMDGEGDTPAINESPTADGAIARGTKGLVYVYWRGVDRTVVSNGKVYA